MSAASKLATMAELLGTIAESECRVRCAQAGRTGELSLLYLMASVKRWTRQPHQPARSCPSQETMGRVINNEAGEKTKL